MTALGRAVEIRDLYTANHTNRVTMYSLLLAEELRLPDAERALLQVGTPLHDIGKIGIEDAVLRKPGSLTATEFEHMKTHTLKGAAILETIPGLRLAIPIARNHHERWDGKGYPDGLAADQIALVARIVAVADAFDAMSSDRPYRKGMPDAQLDKILRDGSGRQWDPNVVDAFFACRDKIRRAANDSTVGAVPLDPLQWVH